MLATGCEDKNIRVYYLTTSNDQPLKVFTGNSDKIQLNGKSCNIFSSPEPLGSQGELIGWP